MRSKYILQVEEPVSYLRAELQQHAPGLLENWHLHVLIEKVLAQVLGLDISKSETLLSLLQVYLPYEKADDINDAVKDMVILYLREFLRSNDGVIESLEVSDKYDVVLIVKSELTFEEKVEIMARMQDDARSLYESVTDKDLRVYT